MSATNTNETLTVQLVQNTDGSINEDASTEAFTSALSLRIEERSVQGEQIKEALTALFDLHFGKSIAMPTVGSLVATNLGAQPENHKVLSDRVCAYIRSDVNSANPTYGVRKGVGGGVCRLADQPTKTDSKK